MQPSRIHVIDFDERFDDFDERIWGILLPLSVYSNEDLKKGYKWHILLEMMLKKCQNLNPRELKKKLWQHIVHDNMCGTSCYMYSQ